MKRRRDTETETPGEMPHDDRGRYWGGTAVSQGTPRLSGHNQKIRERCVTDSPLQVSGGTSSCRHLDFRLSASRVVKEYISVVLNYVVGDGSPRRRKNISLK